MLINVVCGQCGKKFGVSPKAAGRAGTCPKCSAVIQVPTADSAPSPAAEGTKSAASASGVQGAVVRPFAGAVGAATLTEADLAPATSWSDHLYWLLAITLLPLAIYAFSPPPGAAERLEPLYVATPDLEPLAGETPEEDYYYLLPEDRVPGALVERGSAVHWVYGAVSAAGFGALLMFLFGRQNAAAWVAPLLGTIAGGIALLTLTIIQSMAVQAADSHGAAGSTSWFVQGVAYSYRGAAHPEAPFVASLLAYTFGVGLFLELCKGLLVWMYLRSDPTANWQGAALAGLAVGAGFGVAEAVLVSRQYFHGAETSLAYAVLFISDVAMHALWTGSVAIAMHWAGVQREQSEGLLGIVLAVAPFLIGPVALHGLYDTLLKQGHGSFALLIGLVSFGWFVWLVWQQREGRGALRKGERRTEIRED